MKKILIIEFNNHTPHLETSFEIAKQHLDEGDQVHYVFGGHDVPYQHGLALKRIPIKLFKAECLPEEIVSKLIQSERFHYLSNIDFKPFTNNFKENFESIDELMEFKISGCEAGLSVASTIIFDLKASNPALEKQQERINLMLSSALAVYDHTLKLLEDIKPDLVFFFNGRFINYRSVMNACQITNTAFMIHERGANINRFTVRPYMPHDFKKIRIEIDQLWKNTKDIAKSTTIARQFFIDRRAGREQAWFSYIKNQKSGLLPLLNPKKKLISFFTSSDDEFKAVGDIVKWDRWIDQFSALTDVISICSANPQLQLVIRVHPHVSMKSKEDQDFWNNLNLPEGVILVKSDDDIDTYALIEKSDVVLTAGSTIGIESVFWGTPSICLGPSIYENLNAVYLPQNKQELNDLLLSELVANSKMANPYGYYMMNKGQEFIHFEATSLFKGKFLGVDLHKKASACMLRKISNFSSRLLSKLIDKIK